ncbi:MAG: hypothetical protein ABIT38_21930 [Gemmatimonadaceae bacterium]
MGGAFRAIALSLAGRNREAMEQAESLGSNSVVDPLRAHLLLTARCWTDALAVLEISIESKEYLVRVIVPDSVLTSLKAGRDS